MRRPKKNRTAAQPPRGREATSLSESGSAVRQLSIRTFFRLASGSVKNKSALSRKRSLSSLNSPSTTKPALAISPNSSSLAHLTANNKPQEQETVPSTEKNSGKPNSASSLPSKDNRHAALVSNKENKPGAPKVNKKHFQQLYLDLGQRDFGKQTLCNVCGMLYVHGVEEDIKQHEKVCRDFTHGVPFQAGNNAVRMVARMLGVDGLGSICEVRSSDSSALRKMVAQVRVIVDKELGFARSRSKPEDSLTTYLYIHKKRVVGLACAEPSIQEGFRLESNYERSTVGRKAVIGIHQIWVHSKYRGQRIATQLLDTVREKMVFNFVVPRHQIAFSSPTEAGVAFARSYVGGTSSSSPDQVLVYDCH